jgi:hypothetical protein
VESSGAFNLLHRTVALPQRFSFLPLLLCETLFVVLRPLWLKPARQKSSTRRYAKEILVALVPVDSPSLCAHASLGRLARLLLCAVPGERRVWLTLWTSSRGATAAPLALSCSRSCHSRPCPPQTLALLQRRARGPCPAQPRPAVPEGLLGASGIACSLPERRGAACGR